MWWIGQNLGTSQSDPEGRVWHIRVWHDFIEGEYVQRIFFWDEAREDMGVAEFRADQALHVSRLRQRTRRLVRDPNYRNRFRRRLNFPLERHYAGGELQVETGTAAAEETQGG